MRLFGCLIALVMMFGFAVQGKAAPIHVLTLDESRVGTPTGSFINFNFATGNGFAAPRAELLNPTNFGPGGVVPRDVVITTAPELTATSLASTDVVILASNFGWPLSAAEQTALAAFVSGGGGLMAFANQAAVELAPMLGATSGSFTGAAFGIVSDGSSPLASGAFGSVPTGAVLGTGYAGSFADVGPNGSIALTNPAGTLGASFTLGAGRAAIFTDEEIFMDIGQSGFAAAHWTSATRTIFLDSFTWVVPQTTSTPTPLPEPSTLLLLACGLAGLLGSRAWCGINTVT